MQFFEICLGHGRVVHPMSIIACDAANMDGAGGRLQDTWSRGTRSALPRPALVRDTVEEQTLIIDVCSYTG